ncbi:MAG TPA: glycosyltransferase, partial [Brevundimonas sp.]
MPQPLSNTPGNRVVELETAHRTEPIVCLSHLRWNFVFQRPQHLMSRFAKSRTVLVFEEPLPVEPGATMGVDLRVCAESGVVVATPRLPDGLDGPSRNAVMRQLLDEAIAAQNIERPVLWYYTPMMVPIARHIEAAAVVYDCMDELANFRFAPPELTTLERELFASADVVFTGGYSLYEAKRALHDNIHPFPSSVDTAHFAQARSTPVGRDDRRPRLGFFGVIDERMDLDLISRVAEARPDWDFEMVGPVVKIAAEDLPQRPNLSYPGQKSYDELPACLARWDVALMPFAINESTRFISPTKTPEYLAAGRPVVSTPIRDVVRHYSELDAVRIAATPDLFVAGCEA